MVPRRPSVPGAQAGKPKLIHLAIDNGGCAPRSLLFNRDRARANKRALLGWRPLRFTWKMVNEEPAYVAATIREALGPATQLDLTA